MSNFYPKPKYCRDETTARSNRRVKKSIKADPKLAMKAYFIAKRSKARADGIEWDLTLDDIVTLIPADGLCPVTRRPLVMPRQSGDRWDKLNIDRFDPRRGYVKGNVSILSARANTLKSNEWDSSVFRKLADWMDANSFAFEQE